MADGIPSGAVGAAVAILLYSFICLTLSLLLVAQLIRFGERSTYITIFSVFTTLSTSASIVQQLHYVFDYRTIKQAQFEKAVESLSRQGLAFGGAAGVLDNVLFFIQFYCYNVMSLNVFFWAVALFAGSWNIRRSWIGSELSIASKIFAVLFPGIIVGIMQISAFQKHAVAYIVLTCLAMFVSLTMGSILLGLTLWKYVKTRRLVAGYQKRGAWWASESDKSQQDSGVTSNVETANTSSTRRSIYDRALLTRFSIGFVILSIFEVFIIVFSLFQEKNSARVVAQGHPDFAVSGANNDIFLFAPGVSASLLSFLVFGTTKSWRQYKDLVMEVCCIRKKLHQKRILEDSDNNGGGLEFERLPSLHNTHSEDERRKNKEAESRVKMFVGEDRWQDSMLTSPTQPGSGGLPKQNGTTKIVQLLGPTDPVQPSRTSQAGISIDSRDPVIQYDRAARSHGMHLRQASGSAWSP